MEFRKLLIALTAGLTACAGSDNNGNGDCSNGATQCVGNTFQTCENGEFVTSDQCSSVCDNELGCLDCTPGIDYCSPDNQVMGCDDSGNSTGVKETCGDGLFCSSGVCRDLCAEAEDNESYIGCEYFAVDLDNAIETSSQDLFSGASGGTRQDDIFGCMFAALPEPMDADVCVKDDDASTIAGLCDHDPAAQCPAGFTCSNEAMCVLDAQHAPFAVVVSNPQAVDIDVTIENASGQSMSVPLAAGEVKALYPADLGFADQSIDGTSQTASAYRLSGPAPFVAYQFNPLDNEDVFSNDGSLLLPTHTYDSRYYALTLPSLVRRPDVNDYNGYVTAVAWEDGTEVTVTPTAAVRAGESIPAIAANTPTTFTLDAFDVLNLEAVGDGDLTGTLVETTDPAKTLGLFAGHEATVIGDKCCADHIEEMMFPSSTWGSVYAVARSKQRASETDKVRIIAQADNTTVTTSEGSCPTLMAGGFCEIDISGDVEISADQPIMVGHFLRSVGDILSSAIGDPSMALAVPTEQYRSNYSILVPSEYDQQYVSVVTSSSGSVTIDGADVSSQLSSFGSGMLKAGRISVEPGQHDISCPDKCGIEIYGYSDAVSYMFAGGLDLERIVID